MASLAALLVEAFTLGMLEDDRLLKRGQEMLRLIRGHIAYIGRLSMTTWDRLAYHVGGNCTGLAFRDSTLQCVHKANVYLHEHCLRSLFEYP